MHLADAFIQSDLGNKVFVSMCSLGIEPTTFALVMQWCSTTEPQEHLYIFFLFKIWNRDQIFTSSCQLSLLFV